MILILFIYLLISIIIVRPKLQNTIGADGGYISRNHTTMINGFFIWLVFLSHMKGYRFELPDGDYFLHRYTVHYIGQCVVASFFFFSGYGIMISLQRKGSDYAYNLILKRFSLLLLHFSIAVLLYTTIRYSLGTTFPLHRILLSLIGWDTVGNSNWFIFVTLAGYLIIAPCYLLLHRYGNYAFISLVCILFCCLIHTLAEYKANYWVDTCLCIPAGMLFGVARKRIELIVNNIFIPPWLVGLFLIPAGYFMYRFTYPNLWLYGRNLGAIIFALGILFIFSAFSFKRYPTFLCWSGGSALFCLYIFQRIPMVVGAHWGWNTTSPWLYEGFCITATLVIAWLSTKVFESSDKALITLFSRSTKEESENPCDKP